MGTGVDADWNIFIIVAGIIVFHPPEVMNTVKCVFGSRLCTCFQFGMAHWSSLFFFPDILAELIKICEVSMKKVKLVSVLMKH